MMHASPQQGNPMSLKSPGAHQVRKPLTFEAEAQQVLDELWKEKLTPFKLRVGKISKGADECTIHFYDSRIRTVDIPLTAGKSFREIAREAVLERVAQMSGPLPTSPPAHS
jgi:hypothetical protein